MNNPDLEITVNRDTADRHGREIWVATAFPVRETGKTGSAVATGLGATQSAALVSLAHQLP